MIPEIIIPYTETQSDTDPPIKSFLSDLETPRPTGEIESVRSALTEHVETEKARLRHQLVETGQYEMDDIVTGDAPFITPFDHLNGTPEFLPTNLAAEALLHRAYNVWFLMHPKRINALKNLIAQEYTPPTQKNIPIIDQATKNHIGLDFEDLGFKLGDAPNHAGKLSARKLLADGPYTYVANNLVALPYILSSMPDVSNALSIATHVLCGGLAFVPFDSIWNSFENKLAVAQRAWEIVTSDPILNHHPDNKFLLAHFKRLIGITIKANGESVQEVEQWIKNGYTTFRIYDARGWDYMIRLTRDIKKISDDPNITIFVGQTFGSRQARESQEAGSNSVIVGVGAGGICLTPREASLQITNVNIGREILKSGVIIPVVFDGGIGPRMPIVFAMGGAAGLKSAALVGGTIEQPPGLFYHQTPNGHFAKNYSGEAGPRTKWGSQKIDFLRRPVFVEGDDDETLYNKKTPSMTDNTYALLQSLTTAMIFSRITSVQEWQQMQHPDIWTATSKASGRAALHHNTGL